MLVLGLTGSLGAGKSTVAGLLAEAGAAVFDADKAVHDIYRSSVAALIGEAFPGTVRDGVVDRDLLSGHVVGDPPALTRLEAIVHPLVRDQERRFRVAAAAVGRRLVTLEIPLLVETGGASRVDAVVLVTAPSRIRRDRVMERPGMTEKRFVALSERQLCERVKRSQAHFIVENSGPLAATARQVTDLVRVLAAPAAGR